MKKLFSVLAIVFFITSSLNANSFKVNVLVQVEPDPAECYEFADSMAVLTSFGTGNWDHYTQYCYFITFYDQCMANIY